MIDDRTLFALCVWTEARGEPFEGQVAVSRVIHNRMALHYRGDGTVAGTILHPSDFSGFWFDMVGGKYTRVCHTLDDAQKRAETILPSALKTFVWVNCLNSVDAGAIGSSYAWGTQGAKINAEPRTLLYDNLTVSQPAWATPDKLVAKVYSHSFFKD